MIKNYYEANRWALTWGPSNYSLVIKLIKYWFVNFWNIFSSADQWGKYLPEFETEQHRVASLISSTEFITCTEKWYWLQKQNEFQSSDNKLLIL